MRQVRLVMCSVVLVLMGAPLAGASSIAITNASFEDPVLANPGDYAAGNGVNHAFYGWDFNNAYAYPLYWAIARPMPLSSPPDAGMGVGGTVADGSNSLSSYCATPGRANDLAVQQVLTATYQPNATYTLSMDVGQPSVGEYRGYEMALATADGTVLAGVCDNPAVHPADAVWSIGTDPAAGHWSRITAVLTTGDSGGPIGQNIVIRFGTANLGGERGQFDNITLTGPAVPEPGVLTLLATGVVGLVCYAWRTRK